MPFLSDYQTFEGRLWETGTIVNALAYQGFRVPQTGKPVSEALLLGISGGITAGYFTFQYQGYPPHLVLLTRNTFDPVETIFERLAIPRDIRQTSDQQKGDANLREALEAGLPALVWADTFSLPYNNLPYDEGMWAALPVLVYGLDGEQAFLADRSTQPVIVDASDLRNARARIKQDRFRVMTLDAPDFTRLEGAVHKGIWQCISLYVEHPPRGKRTNFGLAALEHWAEMLTNTRNKQSWARFFAPGEPMLMALMGNIPQPGAFSWIQTWTGDGAERALYAEFLEDAAVILNKPDLKQVAALFLDSRDEWVRLAHLLLPDQFAPFRQAGELLLQKRALFLEGGSQAAADIQQLNERLTTIYRDCAADFPMQQPEVEAFRAGLAEQVLRIAAQERAAVEMLQQVMSE